MENAVYIVSFGNSTKYRLSPDSNSLSHLYSDVRSFLAEKFPQLADPNFFDRMSVTRVDADNRDEYAGYPEFDENSIAEIKDILSREVENMESVRKLNCNAPWA